MSDLIYASFRERYLAMTQPDDTLGPLPGFAGHRELFTSEQLIKRLYTVADKLIDNAKICNLTSILAPGEIIRKHFLDSLMPLGFLLDEEIPLDSILDVGTGAGFPLLPWACALADTPSLLTGMDATGKKISHILETRDAIGLPRLDAIQGRAEEAAQTDLRERFSVVTARAVADLPLLLELCAPFVEPGGWFVSLKGKPQEEITAAAKASKLLGLEYQKTISYTLPGGDARALVLYRKITPTPLKYPRKYADILKKTL